MTGVVCASFGLAPTGTSAVDAIVLFFAGAVLAWASASAPWWSLAAAAGAAAAFAAQLDMMLLALAASAAAIFVGARAANWAWVRSAIGAAVAVVLCHLGTGSMFGLPSLVGLTIATALAIAGVRRRSRTTRRRALLALVVLGLGTVMAVGAFGGSAAAARGNLSEGNRAAREGLRLLARGDVPEARVEFEAAARSFRNAATTLDAAWTQPARLVPVVAQHRDSSTTLANGAAEATARIASTLSGVDFDSVSVTNGRVDLTAVAALDAPLTELIDVVDDLEGVIDDADSPWLVTPIRERLDDVRGDISAYDDQGDTALQAVRLAPQILGADGPRVYFVAFCTPSEARGSLGYMGNWAEITVTQGQVLVTRFGRTSELNAAGRTDRRISGMEEFLARYGGYGFDSGPNGTTSDTVWSVITMSPDFPSVAEAVAQLYPQSGGQQLDGVFALDPAALAGLLELTGPIATDDVPLELTSSNLEQYLNVDQYVTMVDNTDRIDALESVAQATVLSVLGADLPGPREMGATFGPLVRDGHLAGWMVDPEEQTLAGALEMAHALAPPSSEGDIGVTINNGSGNKIDAYSQVEIDYARAYDAATGQLDGTVTITLSNDAPATGLPAYVIGNVDGAAQGSNTSYVSVYLPFEPVETIVDGDVVDPEISADRGWYVASRFVNVPAGGRRTLVVHFQGVTPSPPSREPVVAPPDAVNAVVVRVNGSVPS